MRLQNKVFEFKKEDGSNPDSKMLTSNIFVNKNKSNFLLSDLFYGIKKEKDNTIKGYSILEFIDEKGNIEVNNKIYSISFGSEIESFILKSCKDPKDFVLNDKELDEDQVKAISEKIESSAPSEVPTQPLENKTDENQAGVEDSILFEETEEYKDDKEYLLSEGFLEYSTNEKSNYRLFIKTINENGSDTKKVLMEVIEDEHEVLELDEYKLSLDEKNKTFSIYSE